MPSSRSPLLEAWGTQPVRSALPQVQGHSLKIILESVLSGISPGEVPIWFLEPSPGPMAPREAPRLTHLRAGMTDIGIPQ